MFEVLEILGAILALMFVPYALILGFIGLLVFGFWGALIGVVIGLELQRY